MTTGKGRPRRPRRSELTVAELEQIRILADPLRLRMLEAFGEERTTKQVAELLGEKPTRLYHHVEALERAGLIELTRTRPTRGTVEKYFLAVARTFRTDPRAFVPRSGARGEENAAIRSVIATFFDTTAAELSALADRAGHPDGTGEVDEEEALVSFLEVRASKDRIEEVRARLRELVSSLAADDATGKGAESAGDPKPAYRLTLAFYPLDDESKSAASGRPVRRAKRSP